MSDSITNRPGRIFEISAVSNPTIKSIRALSLKKKRDAEGVFLAEGMKLILDAFENGWKIETLIYATQMASNPHLSEIAAKARVKGTNILEVSEKVLSTITRRDNPQMVVGVIQQVWSMPPSTGLNENSVWIVLDRVRDPGNLGTIIRTVDAVGADGIILVGESTDPYSMEAVRATMGSIFNVPVVKMTVAGVCRVETQMAG